MAIKYTDHAFIVSLTGTKEDYYVKSSEETSIENPGYAFVNWNTDPNGTGTEYKPGDIFNPNTDSVLFAQWILKTYDVTFYDKDEMTVLSKQVVNHGEAAIAPSPLTHPGWKFLYWSPNNYEHVTSNLSIIAVYELSTYNISYDLQGGTNDARNPEQYTINDTPFAIYAASKPNSNFTGWKDGDGNIVSMVSQGQVGNISLTATYEPYDPSAISEFRSDQTALGGWKSGHGTKNGIHFKPGTYELTAVGAGGRADIDSTPILYYGVLTWQGYTAGGGSGAFLSGIITISDEGAGSGTLDIHVPNIGEYNRSTPVLPVSTTIVGNNIDVNVGSGWRGTGNTSTPSGSGGIGGKVTSTTGLSSSLSFNGNPGGHVEGIVGVNVPTTPGAPGGSYATDKCKYGGGAGEGTNYPDRYSNKSYRPHYGFVHLRRVGD